MERENDVNLSMDELCNEIRKGINESFYYLGKMQAYSDMCDETSKEMLKISQESLEILEKMNEKLKKY